MIKRDPYNNQARWEHWKERHFDKNPKGTRTKDWKLLIKFLKDMELGLNVPKEKKGKREVGTLLNLSSHNRFFLLNLKKPITSLKKQDLHNLEKEIEDGKILKRNGQKFTAFGNYIKDFKVFWNWLLRIKKVKENIIEDITSRVDKPTWVYLNEEEIKKFFNQLSLDYRTICFFMYDTGMRVTEANSVRIRDFSEDFSKLTITDEASKTFGRVINLKLCTQLVKEFIKENDLKEDDFLFQKKPFTINKYLKYHCARIFGGNKVSNPTSKGKYGNFTLYDIRHNSACYWFNRYPTQKGLMYRFGWRKADKIEYYSNFLGVSDEITDDDLILAQDKNKLYKLEAEFEKMKKENKLMFGAIKKRNKENAELNPKFVKVVLELKKEMDDQKKIIEEMKNKK